MKYVPFARKIWAGPPQVSQARARRIVATARLSDLSGWAASAPVLVSSPPGLT